MAASFGPKMENEMQVDTLYLSHDELDCLYFNGAGPLSDDVQGAIRLFQKTVQDTEERYNRAVSQMAPTGPDGVPAKVYKARIHVHFVIEPA